MWLKGKRLETYIQFIYHMLLNLKDEGIEVHHDIKLPGRSGATHQVDVFYEFERANMRHKVAIECKGRKKPVTKGDVQEFHAKLQDIGNVTGVLVSITGFQTGAIEYAKHYEIDLQCFHDIPSLGVVLAKRLQATTLPEKNDIGEPFWSIMEINTDREVTGTFKCIAIQSGKEAFIPLFFSKKQASEMLELIPDSINHVVIGLRQHHLRFYLKTMINFKTKQRFGITRKVDIEGKEAFAAEAHTAQEIHDEYLILN